jgi:hypothetical protein
MNLELTLMELNQLYYAASKLVQTNRKNLDELGSNMSSINYFKTELHRSEVLRDKIQTALYDEANALDKAREYVESKERDYSKFKEYADKIDETQSEDKKLFTLNNDR